MARTKSTAQKEGRGPGLAGKAATSRKEGRGSGLAATAASKKLPRKGKPVHILKQKRYRRFSQKVSVLREIRAAQKSTALCIPKLPLQRLLREICNNWKLGLRWKSSALLCLQEAAEDFLIEIFNDTCLLAAHAKRVTVMVQDVGTLKRVRWRYDKLLHPSEIMDEKMKDILMVPPTRAPKDTIKIVEVTHDVNTRAKAQTEERHKEMEEQRKTKEKRNRDSKDALQRYIDETKMINLENNTVLQKIMRGLYVFIDFASGQRQLELEMQDVRLLLDEQSLISDSIMYVGQT